MTDLQKRTGEFEAIEFTWRLDNDDFPIMGFYTRVRGESVESLFTGWAYEELNNKGKSQGGVYSDYGSKRQADVQIASLHPGVLRSSTGELACSKLSCQVMGSQRQNVGSLCYFLGCWAGNNVTMMSMHPMTSCAWFRSCSSPATLLNNTLKTTLFVSSVDKHGKYGRAGGTHRHILI